MVLPLGEEKVQVSVSKELYEKVKKYIDEMGGFSSVEEFIEFVLNEVLESEESPTGYSKEEEEKVKERLRSLGYL